MDPEGRVGDVASSLPSPQQEQDRSETAGTSKDHDISEQRQSVNEEDTNITNELSKLQGERPEVQQVLAHSEASSVATAVSGLKVICIS